MELISLSDGDSGFRVRVLGRRSPGVLHLHDQLDAEVLITSSFVSGRLAMSLFPSDLEDWSRALDLLAAGQDIRWRDDDHSPEIRIQPHNEEHETPAVHVEDPGSSCVSVFLPMNLEEGWIDEQRRLLGRVLKEWPSEVLQPSPGVYEWRR
ncbi:DUF5959 family protein [Streptomyces sp. NPDC053792]|uniref:DUF5959 family protein n=1 Tax=Streptomyces sp. NPDC053792 TaxID=3365716 RepID=UPI0037D95979